MFGFSCVFKDNAWHVTGKMHLCATEHLLCCNVKSLDRSMQTASQPTYTTFPHTLRTATIKIDACLNPVCGGHIQDYWQIMDRSTSSTYDVI